MELRVESAEGQNLPNDSYIGVRIGDVLKQGRYEPSRCYHFPQVERRRNARIDIYQHIGSCMLAVDPDVKSSHEVKVQSCHPSFPGTTIKVSVQSRSEQITQQQRELKTKAVKSQAKDYLSKWGIEERLADAVKTMLKVQPEDPIEFLCTHLRGTPPVNIAQVEPTKSAQVDEKPAVPSDSNDQAPSSANTAGVTEPLQEPSAQTAAKAKVDDKPSVPSDQGRSSANTAGITEPLQEPSAQPGAEKDELRRQAGMLLKKAHEDGTLAEALTQVKDQQVAGLRSQLKETDRKIQVESVRATVAEAFSKAVENGELEKMLQETEGFQPDDARVHEHEIRAKAASALIEAAQSGELEKVLLEAKRSEQIAHLEQDSATAVRAKAAAVLMQAAENGVLEQSLKEIVQLQPRRDNMANIRSKAATLLMQAAENGSLAQAILETKGVMQAAQPSPAAASTGIDAEAVREKAAGLMRSSTLDGSLKEALKEVKTTEPAQPPQDKTGIDVDAVREKAAGLMRSSTLDGSLKEALKEVKAESAEPAQGGTEGSRQDEHRRKAEAVRTKTANLLLQAEANGDLAAALRQTRAEAKPSADNQADLAEKRRKAESVRMKTANALLQAEANGDLETALRQTKEEAQPNKSAPQKKDMESVRLKASNLLTSAVDSGDIGAALKQVRQETRERQGDP